MIARVTTYEGQVSPDLDGVRMYDETAIPWLQDAEGFRGLLVLVDRANERTVSLSFWENEELGEMYEVVLGRGVHLDEPLP